MLCARATPRYAIQKAIALPESKTAIPAAILALVFQIFAAWTISARLAPTVNVHYRRVATTALANRFSRTHNRIQLRPSLGLLRSRSGHVEYR